MVGFSIRLVSLSAAGALLLLGSQSWSGPWLGQVLDPSDDFGYVFHVQPHVRHSRAPLRTLNIRQIAAILKDFSDDLPVQESRGVARHLLNLCQVHQFDPAFILALIEVESRFRVHAVSPAGAVGLMQVMPATADGVAKRYGIYYSGSSSLTNPYVNLSIGIRYLAELREKYRGKSPYFHLAAYNLGPGRLDHLMSRKKGFRPTQTWRYYETIRRGISRWRAYADLRRDDRV